MKMSSVTLIAVIMILSSCATASRFSSSGNGQQFQDGIYSSAPSFRDRSVMKEEKAEVEALVAKTKESEIYLFGGDSGKHVCKQTLQRCRRNHSHNKRESVRLEKQHRSMVLVYSIQHRQFLVLEQALQSILGYLVIQSMEIPRILRIHRLLVLE